MKKLDITTTEGVKLFDKIVTAYANKCLVEKTTGKKICEKYLLLIAEWFTLGYMPNEMAEKIQQIEHLLAARNET